MSILADSLHDAELAKSYLLPLLKALLQDVNDSVKIQAVGASSKVANLVKDPETVRAEIVPPLRAAVDNKMVSWRLRFSVAEIAADLAGSVPKEIADIDIVGFYVTLL